MYCKWNEKRGKQRKILVMKSLYDCNAASDTWSDRRREEILFSSDMQENVVLSYCVFWQSAAVRVGEGRFTLRGQGWSDLGVVHQGSGLPLLEVHASGPCSGREAVLRAGCMRPTARRGTDCRAATWHNWGGLLGFRRPQSGLSRKQGILRVRSESAQASSVHTQSRLSHERTGSPFERDTSAA
jgi:hypothetical protein